MKKIIFILIIGILLISLSIISAVQTESSNYKANSIISTGGGDINSSNYNSGISLGIISGNLSSSSYKESLGFFFCIPYTCSELGYDCGSWSDGCGTTLDCGSCSSGYTCSSGICTASPVTPPSGGGGGGGGGTVKSNFVLDKNLIKVLIKQGEAQREIIEIRNIGANSLDISLNPEGVIGNFMIISEEKFSLAPGESKDIFIDVFAKEDESPQILTGRIIVKDEKTKETKIINVIIEIKERKPLFDMIVDVLSKEVTPKSNVKAKIKISNLGDLNNMDILVYSAIKNFNGTVLSYKKENIAIDKQLEITRSLRVPQGTAFGMYIFYSEVSYGDINASSTDTFEVVEKKAIEPYFFIILGGVVTLIILLLIILILKKRPAHKKAKEKKEYPIITLFREIRKILEEHKRERERKREMGIMRRKAHLLEIRRREMYAERKELERKKRIRQSIRNFFRRIKNGIETHKRAREEKKAMKIMRKREKHRERKVMKKIIKPIEERFEIPKIEKHFERKKIRVPVNPIEKQRHEIEEKIRKKRLEELRSKIKGKK